MNRDALLIRAIAMTIIVAFMVAALVASFRAKAELRQQQENSPPLRSAPASS